jgi:hypothetical protein
MDMADQISKLQTQLEEAEADLQESLSEVNQRVEAVGARLRAEQAIKDHPIAALCLGAAAGLIVGGSNSSPSSLLGALVMGAVLGLAVGSQPGEDK